VTAFCSAFRHHRVALKFGVATDEGGWRRGICNARMYFPTFLIGGSRARFTAGFSPARCRSGLAGRRHRFGRNRQLLVDDGGYAIQLVRLVMPIRPSHRAARSARLDGSCLGGAVEYKLETGQRLASQPAQLVDIEPRPAATRASMAGREPPWTEPLVGQALE
jgi:hypothetical protein